MSEHQDPTFSFYFSLVTGTMLAISELLPYINAIKGNGITHVIVMYFMKKSEPFMSIINGEAQPLINESVNLRQNDIIPG